jgi:hypothetical protein
VPRFGPTRSAVFGGCPASEVALQESLTTVQLAATITMLRPTRLVVDIDAEDASAPRCPAPTVSSSNTSATAFAISPSRHCGRTASPAIRTSLDLT